MTSEEVRILYLKRLTLRGFKSFAEPVELEFSEGVSAIVGPNGSGKSNITDAIRWVLGEQSTKSLRGKKMEDVIFSGTEKKQPLSYAEVILTLDNIHGDIENQMDEIVVTRRLFRSGESEYRMNQKNCKLKDIHELFMDTGLGKNGYSLISQGGIENIINASPLELRGIVEEAVGIVNYKAKKQEAEKKLEHTQNNLDRLQDIIDEIEKQLKPLKKQSEKAKEYLEIRNALKKIDLIVFYNNMKEAKIKIQNFDHQLKTLNFDIFETEKKTEEKDLKFRQAKNSIREITEHTHALTEKLEQVNQNIRICEREILVLSGKTENEQLNQERLNRELLSQQKEHQHYQTEMDELIQSKVSVLEGYNEKDEIIRGFLEEKNKMLSDLELEKAKQAENLNFKAVYEQQKNQLNAEILELKTHLAQWITEKSFHEERIQSIQKKQSENEQSLMEFQMEEEQNDQIWTRIQSEVRLLSDQCVQAEEKANTLREMYNHFENDLKVMLSKRDYLKSVQKNYNDYFPSIRTIMNSRDHLGKTLDEVYGPVGELINVPNNYIMAIDVALGAKTQNIIVKHVSTANRCIEILKKQQAGRATFLPLDNLRYGVVENRDRAILSKIEGFQGIASELIDYASKYKSVMDSLLGRVLVASNFDCGKAIQKAVSGKYTVVTVEGEIFYPGGAIVGGFTKKGKQSPLFKKAEIEKLETEMRRQETERSKLKKTYNKVVLHLQKIRENQKKINLKLNSVEQDNWKIKQSREEVEKTIAENERIIENLQKDTESSKQQEENLLKTIEEKQKLFKSIEEAFEKSQENSEDYIDVIRNAIDELNRKVSENRVQLARNNETVKSYEKQIMMINNQIVSCVTKEEQIQNELKICEINRQIYSERSRILDEECKKLKENIFQKKKELENFSTETKEKTEITEMLEKEIKDLNHHIILQNDAKNNIELNKNKLDYQVTHWEESIFENYDMNYMMVKDQYPILSREKWDITPENQRHLKGRMAEMGNVNVNAIEEYIVLNERYRFMDGQYKDLIKGKSELLKIIENLYESMENQFLVQFAKLQKKFTRIFGVLFEGGKAHIEYTDPDNILESGIELVAQPPGKNLKHISLLSGGEKAMIAIALLFSFIELNPSPFCVIDEIDAALDDRNIYRFTHYLEQIAQNNQFIIITHRKTTLEACDAIYGVSMGKNGISKLVAVRLSDYIESEK